MGVCAAKIKYERGRITIGEGVERYILIPMRAYTEIINSLVRLVGDAAGAPLYAWQGHWPWLGGGA